MNLIPKENNPCYGCTDRKAMCGIGCKRYKQFREAAREQKEKSFNREQYDWWMYNKEKSERLKARKEKGRK